MGDPALRSGTAGAPRLAVAGVTKTFGRSTVLRDLDLDIAAGEVHALVGHNGSGKSTFVKVLAGYHRPDPGATGRTDGEVFDLGDAQSAASAGLRFVHQDLGLVESLDSVDNLFLDTPFPQGFAHRIDWRQARQVTGELLGSLGFDFDTSLPVRELSPTQRTALAVARAVRPGRAPTRVVVLDEPTAALPARDVERIFGVIRALQSQGLGVLYISHHLEEIFGLGGRVSVLRDGRRIVTAPAAELDEPTLIDLMVGDVAQPLRIAGAGDDLSSLEPVLEVQSLAARSIIELDFEVRPGEVVGIAGVDGSGRESVAMALYGGINRSGDVTVAGERLPAGRPDLAVEHGLGLVPADRSGDAVMDTMSVTANLGVARIRTRWHGLLLDHQGEDAEARHWTAKIAIRPPDPDVPIGLLSGGNQQKVVLARWLRTELKVLVLDEPTKGVDVSAVAAIWGLVLEAAAAGTAVVVCSSDTDELVACCHRVIVMRRGRVAAVAQGDTLQSSFVDAVALASTN
ncbi:MAG: rbsA 3 [Marmoricola sp.]|nr:rbsA 3 [Marmoricola sp.]